MVGPMTMRPQFVLFGSSIVQLNYSNEGWGAILADKFARKADILLRGYNGWTSRHALQVLDQVFPKVIVYFGGNDSMRPHPSGLSPHVPLPEYDENMRTIAIHLKPAQLRITIISGDIYLVRAFVFLSALPVNEAKIRKVYSDDVAELRTNESCQIYSEACLNLCREMDIKAIDLWTAIQKKDGWATDCFMDGIHLSSEGSKIVVKEILKVFREADWEPSLHWKSLPTEFEQVFEPRYLMRRPYPTSPTPASSDK